MNGRNVSVEKVLSSIEKAAEQGLKIKINMVVQKGINDGEILEMAKFCYDHDYTLRFIEYMDMGNTNSWELSQVFPNREILKILKQHYEIIPVSDMEMGEVSKRYKYKGTHKEIGFISSVTEPFCSGCNRLRISADGKLYTCLFASQGKDLRHLLQKGSDEELKQMISTIWQMRKDQYSNERGSMVNNKSKIEMSYIGG